MVDVGGKETSARRATAEAEVRMSPETAAAVERGNAPKGDVIALPPWHYGLRFVQE